MTMKMRSRLIAEAIGTDHGLRGEFIAEQIGMGFDGLSFYPHNADGARIDGALIYFDYTWGGDDYDRSEDNPRLRVYVNRLDDIGVDLFPEDAPPVGTLIPTISAWVLRMTQEVLDTQFPIDGTAS